MRINGINLGLTNKQTNVVSKSKIGMKQEISFGMKMNNEHAIQKDKVSFGAPEWWRNLKVLAGSAVGGITMGVTELGKIMFDEPSTPREREARFIGDSLVATQAGVTAATCAGGNLIAGAAEPFILIENENTIVEAIADVYCISNKKEVSKIKSEVGIVDIIKYGAGAGGISQAAMAQIAQDAAKEGASQILKETASNIPLIGGIARTGITTVSGKALVEKTIKACKKARPRR